MVQRSRFLTITIVLSVAHAILATVVKRNVLVSRWAFFYTLTYYTTRLRMNFFTCFPLYLGEVFPPWTQWTHQTGILAVIFRASAAKGNPGESRDLDSGHLNPGPDHRFPAIFAIFRSSLEKGASPVPRRFYRSLGMPFSSWRINILAVFEGL